jgi:apolipoprotein D and lipocalin family protein
MKIPHCTLVFRILFLFISFQLLIQNAMAQQPLTTVPFVDLQKYAGKWFEIASFPQRFQKGCDYTTAEYTMTDKGFVIVENRCIKVVLMVKKSTLKAKLL